MQIGNIKLDIPLALAPMAGITDLPYRIICREQGCGLTISEMVSAKGLLYKNIKNGVIYGSYYRSSQQILPERQKGPAGIGGYQYHPAQGRIRSPRRTLGLRKIDPP